MSNLTESNRLTPREEAIIKAAEAVVRSYPQWGEELYDEDQDKARLAKAVNLPDPAKFKKGG